MARCAAGTALDLGADRGVRDRAWRLRGRQAPAGEDRHHHHDDDGTLPDRDRAGPGQVVADQQADADADEQAEEFGLADGLAEPG
jgi:hypothetical protein